MTPHSRLHGGGGGGDTATSPPTRVCMQWAAGHVRRAGTLGSARLEIAGEGGGIQTRRRGIAVPVIGHVQAFRVWVGWASPFPLGPLSPSPLSPSSLCPQKVAPGLWFGWSGGRNGGGGGAITPNSRLCEGEKEGVVATLLRHLQLAEG